MKNTPVYTWLLILISTLFISLISTSLLFTLGLILIEFLLYPLALGIAALLVGLTAVSLSNKLINDGSQTPVEGVVKWCEATAVLLAILLIVGNALGWLIFPPIFVSSGTAVILALVATFSATQLRQTPSAAQPSTRRIVTWLVIAFLAIPLVIFVASLFGWAGA